MKTVSRLALAAAFITGLGGMVTLPALAKDKKQEQKGDGLVLSDAVRKPALAAQTALQAKDLATAETNIAAAEAAAKTDDEKYISASLRLALEAGKISANPQHSAKDDAALVPVLDALLANPKTPQSEVGRDAYFRANIAFNAQQWQVASQLYTRARDAGYVADDLPLQIVKSKVEGGDVHGGLADLDALIKAQQAKGQAVPEDWYRYAIPRVYRANDTMGTIEWTRRWLIAYPTSKNWRDAIYTFGFQGAGAQRLNKRQRIDLFRLMRATKSLPDAAMYKEYAQSCIDLGLPNEAKSVINEGKAAGVLTATDSEATALLSQAQKSIAADKSFAAQEQAANAGKDGVLAAQTADAYLGAGDNAKAIQFYNLALQKGGAVDADEVNTHLGIAMVLSGDKAGAKAKFAAVKAAPRTDVANLWQTFVDAPAPTAGTSTAS